MSDGAKLDMRTWRREGDGLRLHCADMGAAFDETLLFAACGNRDGSSR